MKRSQIIRLLEQTGNMMDHVGGADIKRAETGEVVATITEDVINGMQTAICVCVRLLDGKLDTDNPIEVMSKIIRLYSSAVLDRLGLVEVEDEEDIAPLSTDEES